MSDSAEANLKRAYALHQSGDLAGAEPLYAAVLRASPDHPDALYRLGVLHGQAGRLQQAARLLAEATRLRPGDALAPFNLASTLRRLGRPAEALVWFDRAIALGPDLAEAHFGRANALDELGRSTEALASYDRTIALQPGRIEAHWRFATVLHKLGSAARALGRVDRVLALDGTRVDAVRLRARLLAGLQRREEAIESYGRAVELDPEDAGSLSERADLLHDLGRLDEALTNHDEVVALRPDQPAPYVNRGITLAALRRYEEALADHDRALSLNPALAGAHCNRGLVLRETGRLEEALACCDRALALQPGLAAAHDGRGVALRRLDRPDEALASHDRAAALAPDNADVHSNRGVALHELQMFEEAQASYDRALALRDDCVHAGWNKAQLMLLRGDFGQGWPLYEWRRRRPEFQLLGDEAVPPWCPGMTLKGRSVLVHWEQGLGDTIQFCRYLGPLRAQGVRVLFAPQPALAALMHGLGPEIEIVDPDNRSIDYDLRVPLLSLPLAMGTTLERIPAAPYLRAEADRVDTWRRRLGDHGLRIGVSWQGSPGPIDRGRSFPLAELAPLARRPGVRLISLQKGPGVEQLAALPPGMAVETPGDDLDRGPVAFLDTAAAMESLDLVVTSDTAVAHLAGALGRPVWLALKQVPDWRWLLGRSTSPWYPTMTLFRQSTRGDWSELFRRMADRLAAQGP